MKSLKPYLIRVFGACLLASSVGCLENATIVSVKKDGSGTIVVREFYSPEMSGMVSGFAAMSQELSGQDSGDKKGGPAEQATNPFYRDQAKKRAGELGEGVTLVSSRDKKSKSGWEGYQAKYTFEDVTKLKFALGSGSTAQPGASTSEKDDDDKMEFGFAFKPGKVAELTVVPVVKEKPPRGEDTLQIVKSEQSKPDEFDDVFGELDETSTAGQAPDVPVPDIGGAMAAGMFGSMFKGMRMTLLVMVDGEIVETDATYRSKKKPNLVTIVDMPMDKVAAHPSAMSLMMAKDPYAMEKISKMKIEGVMVADAERKVTIKFK